MSLSKSQCTDVCLYILCLIENYTKGVMSNYIPEMCEVTVRSFIVLWHVQDTKVVCHKKDQTSVLPICNTAP